MLNDKELKDILKENNLSSGQMIEVLIRYIYDMKKQITQIREPDNMISILRMFNMYDFAFKYYGELYKWNFEN